MRNETMLVQMTVGELRSMLTTEILAVIEKMISDKLSDISIGTGEDEYAYGLSGLQHSLGCGIGRARSISADPMYESAKYGQGKSVYFNVSEIRRIDSHKNQEKILKGKRV